MDFLEKAGDKNPCISRGDQAGVINLPILYKEANTSRE